MALTREQLIEMAVDKYFIGCNKNDPEQICSVLSSDCVMRFSAAKFIYDGHAAIYEHMQEFTTTFKVIDFRNFTNIVDVESQSIAIRFQVTLEDYDGVSITMNNCNFFQADENGLFNDCMIFNSGPLQKGFEAGSAV